MTVALPPHYDRTATGGLALDGVDLTRLAAEHGTPLWAISRSRLLANYTRISGAFRRRHAKTEIAYSIKANNVLAVIRTLHGAGALIDASAEHEFRLALAAGVPAGDIILNGNGKSDAALRAAAALGARQVNVDSLDEVRRLATIAAELGVEVRCAVRLHLTYAELLRRDPSYGHNMNVGDGKFGCYVSTGEAMAACEAIVAAPGLQLVGLSHHVGFSGYLGEYSVEREVMHHETSVREVCEFANAVQRRLGLALRRLDLGGGFRSDGTVELSWIGRGERPRTEPLPTLAQYAAAIFDTLDATLEADTPPLVQFETGGYQVADAAVLLTTVQETKSVPRDDAQLRYVVVDSSAMMFVSRETMALGHPVVAVDRPDAAAATDLAEIVGQTCVYDTVADNIPLPAVARGDVLAVLDQGAYCETESTQFNAFPRPEVVLLDAGDVRVARRRETFEDIVARDIEEQTP